MRYYVVSLFPEIVRAFCADGLLGRAQKSGAIHVCTVNPRDFTTDKHRTVDDTPYGGGSGMVMMPYTRCKGRVNGRRLTARIPANRSNKDPRTPPIPMM